MVTPVIERPCGRAAGSILASSRSSARNWPSRLKSKEYPRAFRANHPDVVLDPTIDDTIVYIIAGRGVAFELTQARFSQLRVLQKTKPFEPASARSDQVNGGLMLSA